MTKEIASIPWPAASTNDYSAFLWVDIRDGGKSQFYYSVDGKAFTAIGQPFSLNSSIEKSAGYRDVDWFRTE